MGELEGRKNAWGYAEGGMGGVSKAIAQAAESFGASLHTGCVSVHVCKCIEALCELKLLYPDYAQI